MLIRVDTYFSEGMTEKIMNKIKQQRNFTIVDQKMGERTNKQGISKFVEIPSNGQDDEKNNITQSDVTIGHSSINVQSM
jgi:hypothetical protein